MPQVNRRSSLGHWYAPVFAPDFPRDPPEIHGCTLFERCNGCPYPAILFVPRKSSEINPNSSPILIVPFPTFPGKAIHSGSQSEAGHRSLLMLFLVILRLVDIFPTIW